MLGSCSGLLQGGLSAFHEKAGMSQGYFSLFLFYLNIFLFCLWIPYVRARPPLSPSFHPHSWLSDFRSVHGGRSQYSRCCYLIIDLGSRLSMEAGPGTWRSHLISAVELGCSNPTLRHCAHHFVVVPQWFIDLSTYPQLMKQHSQLPRHGYHRSFLGILSSSLG
jgi:hypothetical protein